MSNPTHPQYTVSPSGAPDVYSPPEYPSIPSLPSPQQIQRNLLRAYKSYIALAGPAAAAAYASAIPPQVEFSSASQTPESWPSLAMPRPSYPMTNLEGVLPPPLSGGANGFDLARPRRQATSMGQVPEMEGWFWVSPPPHELALDAEEPRQVRQMGDQASPRVNSENDLTVSDNQLHNKEVATMYNIEFVPPTGPGRSMNSGGSGAGPAHDAAPQPPQRQRGGERGRWSPRPGGNMVRDNDSLDTDVFDEPFRPSEAPSRFQARRRSGLILYRDESEDEGHSPSQISLGKRKAEQMEDDTRSLPATRRARQPVESEQETTGECDRRGPPIIFIEYQHVP